MGIISIIRTVAMDILLQAVRSSVGMRQMTPVLVQLFLHYAAGHSVGKMHGPSFRRRADPAGRPSCTPGVLNFLTPINECWYDHVALIVYTARTCFAQKSVHLLTR